LLGEFKIIENFRRDIAPINVRGTSFEQLGKNMTTKKNLHLFREILNPRALWRKCTNHKKISVGEFLTIEQLGENVTQKKSKLLFQGILNPRTVGRKCINHKKNKLMCQGILNPITVGRKYDSEEN
jgi:hypothetical protein